MEPAELRVVQVAQQLGAAGLQASKAYNDAQESLDLHLVLTPARLGTTEGTSESLEALTRLSELTSAHKEVFAKFVTMASEHLASAVSELPADLRAEYRDGMVSSINWNLAAQGDVYKDREEWIVAAVGICKLVEFHRESITFTNDGVLFRNDDTLEAFERLVATADRIHHREVARTNERLARLARSTAILSASRS